MKFVDAPALRRAATVLRGDAVRAEWWSTDAAAARPSLSPLTDWSGAASALFHVAVEDFMMRAGALDGALAEIAPRLRAEADRLEGEAELAEREVPL